MSKQPLGFAFLLACLSLTNGFASDKKEAQRPLQPTTAELQEFQLPRPQVEQEPAPPTTPLFQISGVGMFAASASDFATTEWGLSRGLQEGNPVASDRGIRLVHHVIGPAAVYWTTEKLQKNGKTKLALTLRLALMAAYSYAAIHNAHQVNGTTTLR